MDKQLTEIEAREQLTKIISNKIDFLGMKPITEQQLDDVVLSVLGRTLFDSDFDAKIEEKPKDNLAYRLYHGFYEEVSFTKEENRLFILSNLASIAVRETELFYPYGFDKELAFLFKADQEFYSKLYKSDILFGRIMDNNDYLVLIWDKNDIDDTSSNIVYGQTFLSALPEMWKFHKIKKEFPLETLKAVFRCLTDSREDGKDDFLLPDKDLSAKFLKDYSLDDVRNLFKDYIV